MPTGQAAGDYSYKLTFEPSPGVTVAGVPVDAKSGAGVVPVTFSVPEAPAPAWQAILLWAGIALVALLVILAIVFVVLCLITGVGFGAMLRLIWRKLRPRIGDARIQVTAPEEAVQQHELTDARGFELGPTTVGLATMPGTLRFEPRISILRGDDELRVSSVGAGSFFTITRAVTSAEEFTSDSTLGDKDVVRLDLVDGRRCQFVFGSYKYKSS